MPARFYQIPQWFPAQSETASDSFWSDSFSGARMCEYGVASITIWASRLRSVFYSEWCRWLPVRLWKLVSLYCWMLDPRRRWECRATLLYSPKPVRTIRVHWLLLWWKCISKSLINTTSLVEQFSLFRGFVFSLWSCEKNGKLCLQRSMIRIQWS